MKENNGRLNVGQIIGIILVLFCLYCVVADMRYRWNHPEKTSTQLFFDTFKIITWQ